MKITVIGGGGTGITFASDMVAAGHSVTMYEREDRAENLLEVMSAGEIRRVGQGPVGIVNAPKITFNAQEAVEDAEIIFIAQVSNRHQELSALISPYLRNGQCVCFFNGNAGSLILKRQLGQKDVLVGETVANYTSTRYVGNATVNYASPVSLPMLVSAFPAKDSKRLTEKLCGCLACICYPDAPVKNVLEAALNSPNVTVHLIAAIMNISGVERAATFRLYKDGLSPSVLKLIEVVRDERQKILDAFGYVGHLIDAVGIMHDCMNYLQSPIPALAGFWLTTGPTGPSHRYISEDAFAGNSMLLSMGKKLHIETPILSASVAIASALNDTDYYRDGFTLENFGLADLSVMVNINQGFHHAGPRSPTVYQPKMPLQHN